MYVLYMYVYICTYMYVSQVAMVIIPQTPWASCACSVGPVCLHGSPPLPAPEVSVRTTYMYIQHVSAAVDTSTITYNIYTCTCTYMYVHICTCVCRTPQSRLVAFAPCRQAEFTEQLVEQALQLIQPASPPSPSPSPSSPSSFSSRLFHSLTLGLELLVNNFSVSDQLKKKIVNTVASRYPTVSTYCIVGIIIRTYYTYVLCTYMYMW